MCARECVCRRGLGVLSLSDNSNCGLGCTDISDICLKLCMCFNEWVLSLQNWVLGAGYRVSDMWRLPKAKPMQVWNVLGYYFFMLLSLWQFLSKDSVFQWLITFHFAYISLTYLISRICRNGSGVQLVLLVVCGAGDGQLASYMIARFYII